MRFFKAFNLLHRRTKSATFVPGLTGQPLDFTIPDVRSSSLTIGQGIAGDGGTNSPLSLFDFITSEAPPIPANFTANTNSERERAPTSWSSRVWSGRDSLGSLQSTMEKEQTQLREALNNWIREHSKVQVLLKNCHAELHAERQKTRALEKKKSEDRQVILSLRKRIANYEKLVDQSRAAGSSEDESCSSDCMVIQTRSYLAQNIQKEFCASQSRTTLGISRNLRTLDEYSSALRMTLATRKELREQRKVAKFWKSKALNNGQLSGVITPSTSTMSSIYEILPTERQIAVNALMSRRGLLSAVVCMRTEDGISEFPSRNITGLMASSINTLPSNTSSLSSFPSKSSGISRLQPLASQSMKAEINLLFGTYDRSKNSVPSKKRRSSPEHINIGRSKVPTAPEDVSTSASLSLSIESFGDLTAIFETAFGLDHLLKDKQSSRPSKEVSDIDSLDSWKASSVLHHTPLPSSVCLAMSSVSSGSSQVFAEAITLSSDSNIQQVVNLAPASSHCIQNVGVKQVSKSCTSRRSWQRYMMKSFALNQSSDKKSSEKTGPHKVAAGKENASFSMSLPVFKKRGSRLPVPVFAKQQAN